MREQDQSTNENTGMVAALFHDALANLGVMESSMSVRISPRFAAFLEHSGRCLSIAAICFYCGMLAMHREPTEADRMAERIKHRAALIRLETVTKTEALK